MRQTWQRKREAINVCARDRGDNLDAGFTPAEFAEHARASVLAIYPQLAAAFPDLASLLGNDYRDAIIRSFDEGNEKNWRRATSKVMSLGDLLLDPVP